MKIVHWIQANPLAFIFGVYGLANFVVAVTPQRFQKQKWYGGLLWLAHRLSWLTHSDAIGTLQWPIIAKAIFFGQPDPGVASAAAAHAASLAAPTTTKAPEVKVEPADPPVPIAPVSTDAPTLPPKDSNGAQ
jgi:hypothetical protein